MKLGVCGGGGDGLEAVSPTPLFPKDAKDTLGSWQLSVVCVYLVGILTMPINVEIVTWSGGGALQGCMSSWQ